MRHSLLALLITLPLLPAAAPPQPGPAAADLALLQENKVGHDGPALLAFLRKRYVETTDAQIKALIAQLGDDSFDQRHEASRCLRLLGARAKPFLKAAARSDDLEVRYRARRCLRGIDTGAALPLEVAAAAIRRLALLRPAGATTTLLRCIGSAEDDVTRAEMQAALVAVGLRGGVPDKAILAALTDPSQARRAAAGGAIARAGSDAYLPAVRKLLKDTDLTVRVRTALVLLERGERQAVVTLIDAMEAPPTRETGIAEELLFHLAGTRSPALAEPGAAGRKKYRAAWQTWWKAHGARADLAVLRNLARFAGHTTVVLLDLGEVVELDSSNRVRWRITGLKQPLDVQRLPGDRVLVAEHAADRVTERDSKGEIVWECAIRGPLAAQRLANGNTLVTSQTGLTEVDARGREVSTYSRPTGERIMRARRLPGGDTVLITSLGVARFVRMDRFHKDVSSFGVEVYTSGGRIDLTPAGNVLICELHNNLVTERAMDGSVVRQIKIDQPITATALPNGHVVITSMTQKRAVEIDRAGKEVWEYKRETRVTRAVRH